MKILEYFFIGILLLYALFFAHWLYRIHYPTLEHTVFQNDLNTRGLMDDIAKCLIIYKTQQGSFPPAESNLVDSLILIGGRIEGCPHNKSQFLDRFGNVIIYNYDGTNAVLSSPGADRVPGSDDDILLRVNIENETK